MESKLMEIEDRGELQVVKLFGELTYTTANGLIQEVDRLLKIGKRKFVFVFESLDFIDSSGIGSLLLLSRSIKNEEGKMAIAAVPDSVLGALNQLQITKIIDTFPSTEVAIGHLN